jgi:predicted nucleic acid-binding protein
LIYYDSSALLKLIRPERESEEFVRWYANRRDIDATSSALVRVEVIRAARLDGENAELRARAVLDGVDLMPMDWALLDRAAVLPFAVRSLDAIHLASAIQLGGKLRAFVAYDRRLLAAAEHAGLPVASPGAS